MLRSLAPSQNMSMTMRQALVLKVWKSFLMQCKASLLPLLRE
ncbi:hypothetical protein GGE65_008199 [Skermanella aerolata]